MKKKSSFLALTLALLVVCIYSCEKSQLAEESQEEVITNTNLYRLSIVDNEIEVETLDREHIASHLQAVKETANNMITLRNGNNHKAMGLVNMGDDMATFNAVKNNGGVNGNTHISGPNFWIDLKFDSECLLVVDNKAFWGGTVTAYEVGEPLQGLPFGIGWQFFWSAIDNGEGSQADPDEIGDALIVIPPGLVAADFGFETWCDFTAYDYDLLIEGVHYPHNHNPGDDPTNIQID